MIDYRELENDFLFGLSKLDLLQLCLISEFPGTPKWEPSNPIWDCNVYNHMSPKDAWKREDYLLKAINNLFKITKDSIARNKYENFVNKIECSFQSKGALLLQEILNRFTVAKIAPRVTAISSGSIFRILKDSKIDLSNGVYCPMAGFGGIIEGVKRWFSLHKINEENKIEAFDINRNFCKYYGWIERDLLEKVVVTNKTVVVCPPFGLKTERWNGTPEVRNDEYETNYLDFEVWCKLIREYVKSPNYIFIGPEINKNKNKCGLFAKRLGIQWYPNL